MIGDIVNILPPRGVMENMTSDVDEHEQRFRVLSIADGKVHLKALESDKETDVAVEDVVALSRFDEPIYAGLKEVDRIERGGSKPFQVVINGENFYALEAMMFAYQGKVDCIYIDPPYNSGAKDWKYNNNYVGQDDQYRHSKWLTFMEDRLHLAKKLLNPNDSVLICTIDEKEYLRLGLLLEQLFPEANIQMVSSVINHASVARFNEFNRNNEYVFFVMIGDYVLGSIDDSKTATEGTEVAWNTLRRHSPSNLRHTRPRQFYPIYINTSTHRIEMVGDPIPPNIDRHSVEQLPGCVAVFPVRDNGTEMLWGVIPSELKRRIAGGYVRIGKYEPEKPQQFGIQVLPSGPIREIEEGRLKVSGYRDDGSVIVYHEGTKKVLPKTQWDYLSHDAKTYGSNITKEIFKDARFSYPKGLYAVADALKLFVGNKKESLILDFFAGSGTTLQAVNLLNSEDGGKRRCICITNNEVSADEAKSFSSNNLRQGDPEWEARGIAHYVTWPRTKCVIEGVNVIGQPLKGTYIGSDRPMSDGFEENAVFYDLEYLEPSMVAADLAFNEIAPLLWMKAGSRGKVIQHGDSYDISENYAVLFNYSYSAPFMRELKTRPDVKMVFVVTDYDARYRSMCSELPDKTVVQLYDSYLRSFEISSEE